MPGDEQQRLFSAHRAADCVDPARIDSQPGQRRADELGHPGQVVDLSRRAPGEAPVEVASLAVGIDDDEAAAEGRQIAPAACVRPAVEPAPVRRDHEREGGVAFRAVPLRQQHDGVAQAAVEGPVGDRDLACGRARSGKRGAGGGGEADGDEKQSGRRAPADESRGGHAATVRRPPNAAPTGDSRPANGPGAVSRNRSCDAVEPVRGRVPDPGPARGARRRRRAARVRRAEAARRSRASVAPREPGGVDRVPDRRAVG